MLAAALLVLFVPPEFNGHVMIVLGLALLVAAVRDLGKLANVHLRRRDRLATSDAYLLSRATSIPAAVWIVLFAAVVAGAWWFAWQPMAQVLRGTAATVRDTVGYPGIGWDHEPDTHTDDPGFSTKGAYVTGGEEFTRDTNYIEDRITRDGAPGRNGEPGWPVEPGRYRLIAARACPWANRTVIVRRLLGLEDVISLGQPGPTHDARSWTFDLDPGRQGSGPRHRTDPGRLLPPVPGLPPRHHRPGDRGRRQRAGGDQQLPADHAGLLHRVDRSTTGRARRTCTRSTCARKSTRSTSGSSPR